MTSLNDCIHEYHRQLKKGPIKEAYSRLMKYILSLKTHFKNNYPDYAVSSSIYQGLMDVTFFTITPPSFKKEKLKVVIVFIHEDLRFDIWLAGQNRQVQAHYWTLFKESDWDKYRIPSNAKQFFSIIEHTLSPQPDFDDLAGLTRQIEEETLTFIREVSVDLLL